MKTRIFADARFETLGHDAVALDASSCRAWVERALDDEIEAAIVLGDDSTLSTLATAHAEVGRRRPDPLWFSPVAAGDPDTVVTQLGGVRGSARALKRLVRRIENGEVRRTSVSTLRVVDSTDPRARLVFSFGMGAFTRLFGPGARVRRRDTLRDAMRGTATVEADVRLDWEEHATRFGYLLASTLDVSWARVKMGGPASIRLGASPFELLRGATKVGRVLERAAGGMAMPFGCVHIDTNSDYVVDGALVSAATPRLIALTPGPQLRILV